MRDMKGMKDILCCTKKFMAFLLGLAVIIAYPVRTLATETVGAFTVSAGDSTVSTGDLYATQEDKVSVPVKVELPTEPGKADMPDVISIELPVIEERSDSAFDFHMDPYGLIYATDAMRYGGGTVEKDATLYFHNKNGEYDFSSQSDRLAVINKSTVPVRVTVTAWIEGAGDLQLVAEDSFGDSEEPDVYLAILDDQGNVYPLADDGRVSVTCEIGAADEGTYVWHWDEAAQDYAYTLQEDSVGNTFDTYSFGLKGACNPNGDWTAVDTDIRVVVMWSAEPVRNP